MIHRIALLLLAAGCSYSSVPVAIRCDITLSSAAPAAALPGELVVITGTPLTEDIDTAVYIDGVRAQVVEVDRSTCEEAAADEAQSCDACRRKAECIDCLDCDDCDALCDRTCVETVSIIVPALAAGPAELRLFNGHGESAPLTLEILGESDTGG